MATLDAVARGDRVAFRALYDETSPKLFGVVRRILRDQARSEDVLQDVYVRIWQSAGAFDATRGTPFGWMASLARNRAIDIIRRDVARRAPADLPPDDGAAGLDLADAQLLQQCLAELDAEQSRCVLLAYRDGWSREELAVAFTRPVGTIKSWLSRCLATLRACLTANG